MIDGHVVFFSANFPGATEQERDDAAYAAAMTLRARLRAAQRARPDLSPLDGFAHESLKDADPGPPFDPMPDVPDFPDRCSRNLMGAGAQGYLCPITKLFEPHLRAAERAAPRAGATVAQVPRAPDQASGGFWGRPADAALAVLAARAGR